jgi:hypothetical protein
LQKSPTHLTKERYQKNHFLKNANGKYYQVELLLASEPMLLSLTKENESRAVAKLSIWQLADYYFSVENKTTFFTKYDLQMSIESTKDDFNEIAINIYISNIHLWKKEIKLTAQERDNLKQKKQTYQNQVDSLAETAAEIWLETPTFGQIKDTSDVYITDGKPISPQKDGSFSYPLALGMAMDTEKKINLQITENQYTITNEIWVQRNEEAQVRHVGGSVTPAPTTMRGPAKYYALFIAVQDYENETLNLKYPIGDAEKLKNTLVEYYTFNDENITFLKNPTRNEIIGALDALTRTINDQSKDGKDANINLLIFYAGHGHLDNDLNTGFWYPKDAQPLGQGNRGNWFSNSDFRDYVRAIKTQHTLVVVDACFAGSLLMENIRRETRMSKEIRNMYELKSRKAMTSGALTAVPDKSAFLQHLVNKLTTYAKESKEKYLDAATIFYDIRPKVVKTIDYNSRQNPVYGAVAGAFDELGEFIFTVK